MSIHNFATANLAGASGASSFFNGATSRSLRFDGGSYALCILWPNRSSRRCAHQR